MTNAPILEQAPALDVSQHALFLDIDGTLVDFAPTPEEVQLDADARNVLRALAERLDGALAVLTGRRVSDAERILAGAVDCVAGLHGHELKTGGGVVHSDGGADWPLARDALKRLVAERALDARVEDKGHALALHYRHAPNQREAVLRAVEDIARRHDVRALHGNMVSEMMPRGATKGLAVFELMRDPPFSGRIPVAVGDDLTDEDAFAAVNELGGHSILVGAPRATAAKHRLAGVPDVRAWLQAAVKA